MRRPMAADSQSQAQANVARGRRKSQRFGTVPLHFVLSLLWKTRYNNRIILIDVISSLAAHASHVNKKGAAAKEIWLP
jgi:hypothetical protein